MNNSKCFNRPELPNSAIPIIIEHNHIDIYKYIDEIESYRNENKKDAFMYPIIKPLTFSYDTRTKSDVMEMNEYIQILNNMKSIFISIISSYKSKKEYEYKYTGIYLFIKWVIDNPIRDRINNYDERYVTKRMKQYLRTTDEYKFYTRLYDWAARYVLINKNIYDDISHYINK